VLKSSTEGSFVFGSEEEGYRPRHGYGFETLWELRLRDDRFVASYDRSGSISDALSADYAVRSGHWIRAAGELTLRVGRDRPEGDGRGRLLDEWRSCPDREPNDCAVCLRDLCRSGKRNCESEPPCGTCFAGVWVMYCPSDPLDSTAARLRLECESARNRAKQFREQLRDAIKEVRAARERRSAASSPPRARAGPILKTRSRHRGGSRAKRNSIARRKEAVCKQQVRRGFLLMLCPKSTMARRCERG
jgi:hypothetical protein